MSKVASQVWLLCNHKSPKSRICRILLLLPPSAGISSDSVGPSQRTSVKVVTNRPRLPFAVSTLQPVLALHSRQTATSSLLAQRWRTTATESLQRTTPMTPIGMTTPGTTIGNGIVTESVIGIRMNIISLTIVIAPLVRRQTTTTTRGTIAIRDSVHAPEVGRDLLVPRAGVPALAATTTATLHRTAAVAGPPRTDFCVGM